MTTVPIPDWNSQGVIPPVDPLDPTGAYRSPYQVGLADLVLRFGTSSERCRILDGLLGFRAELHRLGFTVGFHWLDGSFLEDIEHFDARPPRDIDVVTFLGDRAGPPLVAADLQLFDPIWVKAHFDVDSYFVELSLPSPELVAWSAYWYSIWSHRRTQLWRGYLQLELSPTEDDAARASLQRIQMTEE